MNIYKTVAVGLCAVVFGIMPGVANAQYDDYTFDGGFDWGTSYDFGGYDNYTYDGGFDWGTSYDPSGYDNYTYDGGFDWGTSYDPSGYDNYTYSGGFDWGTSYDPYTYDNYTYDGGFDWGTTLGSTEYEYNPGATEYEYNPFAGATEYEYNPNATEYEYNPTLATEYEFDPGCGSDCYTYYNSDCGCYEVAYSGGYYGGSRGGFSIPSFGGMTITPPRYSTPSYPTTRTVSTPTYPQTPRPTPTTPTQPSTPINIVNNNTNTNTNTNVTTVTPATTGTIVQYVAPQYPVYTTPTYVNYPTYYPNYYYNQAPYCTISISQGYIGGGTVTLSWSSQGATSAYITPQVGQVAPNGSTSLYAYGNSVYTMTVSGPGGTNTCRTQSYIAPAAPVSPYVSLTQIPYTGLSLGPIGNAIYWMSLISLAVAGAYLLVYYKGGALALATSMIGRSDETNTEEAPIENHEVKTSHVELPTAGSSMTRDAMRIVRSEDGTPRLVISRS